MDNDFKKNVLAESRERQVLAHPCILPIKEVYNDKVEIQGADYDCNYMVSPLATGGTLEEMIARRRNEGKPMNEQELMGLFAVLVLAMEETHA